MEDTVWIGAVYENGFSVMINLEVIFFQFSAAEGACKQLLVNQSSLSGGFARIVRAVFQFFKIAVTPPSRLYSSFSDALSLRLAMTKAIRPR